MIVVHVTHEAVEKIGGIGAVIDGLMSAESYGKEVERTILLGPLLNTDRPVSHRLGENGKVIYSSMDGICPEPWRDKFMPIEKTYDVGIIYGTRKVGDPYNGIVVDAEVLLVDVFHFNKDRLNLFKGELYRKFAVPSLNFENVWEYEQYIRLAEPGMEALRAIGGATGESETVVLAHEYMGLPSALKAVLANFPRTQTIFYAHEVASVRTVVEKTPGHETMFYNVMNSASQQGKTMEEVFPEVFDDYKHPLIKAARYCDGVFAVGDLIESELRFLDRHFRDMPINLVYNGIPAEKLTLDQRIQSRKRMAQYSQNLFGIKPTWVFAHVARPVLSKGIWRDLEMLHHLEPLLAERGETAVYFMLGTFGGQKRYRDICQMERVYGWPVNHEEGYPDLCGGEDVLGGMFADFNRGHETIRAVFVNQWGWDRRACGLRMPEEMTFTDIRCGSDLELGLSVYEPFGISQLEALCFGALCAVSNVCGCLGFARRAAKGDLIDSNIIEADYVKLPEQLDSDQIFHMTNQLREKIESAEGKRLAEIIVQRLPRDNKALANQIKAGRELAERMSWEKVMQDYFLPGLEAATRQD